VVDDFYRNPTTVREFALQHSEWTPASRDERAFCDSRTNETAGTDEANARIAQIMGGENKGNKSSISGYFTFIGDGAQERLAIHADPSDWVGVIFLSSPDQGSGGISFYRRCDRQSTLDEQFEETVYLPMKFNRLVLFRGSTLFHRASSGFGRTPESGRLAQVLQVNDVNGQPHEEDADQ